LDGIIRIFLDIKTIASVQAPRYPVTKKICKFQNDIRRGRIYSIIKNLVLWARSEISGFATIECPGVLEYWNVGITGLAE
jgi:hypothetical protein